TEVIDRRARSHLRGRCDPVAATYRLCCPVARGILGGGQRRATPHFLPDEWNQRAHRIQRLLSGNAGSAAGGADRSRLVAVGASRVEFPEPNLRLATRAKRLFRRMVPMEFEILESGSQVLALRSPTFPEHNREHFPGL